MSDTMRAMSASAQGVEVVQVPKPVPGRGEVGVRVIAASVNPGEEKVLEGGLVGRFLHAKTDPLVLGWDFAGTVDAVGDGVTDLQVGQPVWGHLAFSNTQRQGSYAEYVTLPRRELAAKPDDVPFEVAAASATVTMTGLQSLRDLGGLTAGGHALVIGAAGGIGAVSVGIAARLGGGLHLGLQSARHRRRAPVHLLGRCLPVWPAAGGPRWRGHVRRWLPRLFQQRRRP